MHRSNGDDATTPTETVAAIEQLLAARSDNGDDATIPTETAVESLAVAPADVEAVVKIRPTSWKGRLAQLDQIMPAVLFLLFYKFGNTVMAVAAATGWSLKAVYSRRRQGLPVGAWLPCLTAYLMLRAAVSIAVEREVVDFVVSAEAVYFGIGIATKVFLGLAAVATILMGRPFALRAVHWVVVLPETMSSHPCFVSALRNVTWVIAFFELGTAASDIVLYNSLNVSMFLIFRQIASFVVSFVLILGTAMYLDQVLEQVPGWPGLEQLLNPPKTEAGTETASLEAGTASPDR